MNWIQQKIVDLANKWQFKESPINMPLTAFVRDHIDSTNEVLPKSARIARFLLLHKELDADDAELTRTRKVRRGFVAERYRELVTALYGSEDGVSVQSEINYQDGSTAMVETELKITTLDHHREGSPA